MDILCLLLNDFVKLLYWGATNANDVTNINPTNLLLNDATVFKAFGTGGTARWDNSIAYSSLN
jgi:hypothetical protein